MAERSVEPSSEPRLRPVRRVESSPAAARKWADLAAVLERHRGKRLLILLTGYPDPDNIGSGLALQALARGFDIESTLLSFFEVSHQENRAMVKQLDVDLRSAFLCARAAAPHMRRMRGGRIINVSDWVARSGRPRYEGYLTYYVAKAGVIALTEGLALELAGDQILVNAIAPGPIVAPEDTSNETFAAVERATPEAAAAEQVQEPGFEDGESADVQEGVHAGPGIVVRCDAIHVGPHELFGCEPVRAERVLDFGNGGLDDVERHARRFVAVAVCSGL